MKFKIKDIKKKEPSINKTLYIKQALAEKIEQIAIENDTSWNNVVISMIESCLQEDE